MSVVVIGIAVVGTVIAGVAIRKAWYGFHRLVGISPKKMTYIPPEQQALQTQQWQASFQPQLIQVNLSTEQLSLLPFEAKQQLQRVDDKADIYQQWLADLEKQDNHLASPATTTENQFVLSKLMSEHLPNIVNTYQNIIKHKQRIQSSTSHSNQDGIIWLEDKNNNKSQKETQKAEEALSLLTQLLDDIESRLDILLRECERQQIQELQVMKRYLQARD